MKKNNTDISTKFKKPKILTPSDTPPFALTFKPKSMIKRYHKITIVLILVGIISIVLFAFLSKGLLIAATVNGKPISRFRVIQELEKQGGNSVLSSIISDQLIYDKAEKQGITISDAEVEEELKNVEQSLPPESGGLEDELSGQGRTLDDLKKRIKTQKLMEKLVADKIQVSDEEVTAYARQYEIPLEGKNSEYEDQIKNQLSQQKIQTEIGILMESLQKEAKIKYYIKY